MIDRTHELPLVRQCEVLELPRSTAYYTPKPTSATDLALMRRIDELHLEHPCETAWKTFQISGVNSVQ
jgi:putative transposase